MFKKITGIVVSGLLPYLLAAQVIVPVFAEFEKGDSVENAFALLTAELNKANLFSFPIQRPQSFNNKGILLLQTNQADKYKINYPVQLKIFGPEGIYINGNDQSVTVMANSALALREAVYFYLEQLGFHYYFPGDIWKIIPRLNTPYKRIVIFTHPAFEYRQIANGHAFANSEKLYKDFYGWAEANRMGGSFPVYVGHSYDDIVQRNADLFRQHPEYFGQPVSAGTLPAEFKFNVANKDLVTFIVRDAISRYELQVKRGDPKTTLSMEPSDGGKFCTSPECLAIGNPSDQVFYLANIVAKALQEKYPGTWVGTYAYNEHILPTKYKLEPNVFVTITNGFNNSKYSTEELLQLWKKKASRLGIYDYISVYEWNFDMPGQVPAAKINYLKKSIKKYYESGASVYLAESVLGWINKGPGQYIASKLLWDININTDSLLTEFYNIAFENTALLIKKLYGLWENYPYAVPTENDMADWFSILREADKKARTDAVRKRIEQIKMYLNYIVLYRNLNKSMTEENLQKILTYAFRTFDQAAFPTMAVLVSLPSICGYSQLGWFANPNQKWRDDKRPLASSEIQASFRQSLQTIKKTEGIAKFPRADRFVKLSTVMTVTNKKYDSISHASWFKSEYIIQLDNQSADNFIFLRSDYSAQPPLAKPVTVKIFPLLPGAPMEDDNIPVLNFEQSKKGISEKFSLAALKKGTYRLIIDDLRKVFVVNFSPAISYCIVADAFSNVNTTSMLGLNMYYFYVPKGVKKFQLTKTSGLVLTSPSGRKIDRQNGQSETVYIDVLTGETGLWMISWQGGIISLEGVPGYLGDHPATMLVPAYLKE